MPQTSSHIPAYGKHRATGQARVVLNGRCFYLGKHGTPESKTAYRQLIQEWLARGRRLPQRALTVTELILAFWKHAQVYASGLPHQLHHQWRACRELGERTVPAPLRSAHSGVAAGQPVSSLRDQHPPGRSPTAHAEAKRALVAEVKRRSGASIDPTALTLGFARRATAYKRADLLFTDLDRLRRIARQAGPLQIVYGGKAHPRDDQGKEMSVRFRTIPNRDGTHHRLGVALLSFRNH